MRRARGCEGGARGAWTWGSVAKAARALALNTEYGARCKVRPVCIYHSFRAISSWFPFA